MGNGESGQRHIDAGRVRPDRRAVLAGFGAATAAAWVAPSVLSSPVALAAPSNCASCGSANRIGNPSGELVLTGSTTCDPNISPTCTQALAQTWTVTNTLRLVDYATFAGTYAPTPPSGAGNNFFSGSWASGTASPGTATSNTISFAACGAAIDAGSVTYDFSAWLGGYSTCLDTMQATLNFRTSGNALISSVVLGPVTAADRSNLTTLLFQQACGTVPASTRLADVVLTATKNTPTATEPRNTGYGDLISLTVCPAC